MLAPSADGYISNLPRHENASRTIRTYLDGIGHFAVWLNKIRLPFHRVDEVLMRRFLAEHLPYCDYPMPRLRRPIELYAALRHVALHRTE